MSKRLLASENAYPIHATIITSLRFDHKCERPDRPMVDYKFLLADDLGSCFSASDSAVSENIALVVRDEMHCRRDMIRETVREERDRK